MVSKSDNDGGFDGLGDRFSKVSNSGCGDVGVARFEEILNSGHVVVARYCIWC